MSYGEARAGFFNKGRLTTVADPRSSFTVDYDAAGRPVKLVRSLDGTSYVAERRYDAGGRILASGDT